MDQWTIPLERNAGMEYMYWKIISQDAFLARFSVSLWVLSCMLINDCLFLFCSLWLVSQYILPHYITQCCLVISYPAWASIRSAEKFLIGEVHRCISETQSYNVNPSFVLVHKLYTWVCSACWWFIIANCRHTFHILYEKCACSLQLYTVNWLLFQFSISVEQSRRPLDIASVFISIKLLWATIIIKFLTYVVGSKKEPGLGGLGGRSFGIPLKCPLGGRGGTAGSGLQEAKFNIAVILHLLYRYWWK